MGASRHHGNVLFAATNGHLVCAVSNYITRYLKCLYQRFKPLSLEALSPLLDKALGAIVEMNKVFI
jgi:L-2-hydroxyglutarate oxidase LhgO